MAKDISHAAFPTVDLSTTKWFVDQRTCGWGLGHATVAMATMHQPSQELNEVSEEASGKPWLCASKSMECTGLASTAGLGATGYVGSRDPLRAESEAYEPLAVENGNVLHSSMWGKKGEPLVSVAPQAAT